MPPDYATIEIDCDAGFIATQQQSDIKQCSSQVTVTKRSELIADIIVMRSHGLMSMDKDQLMELKLYLLKHGVSATNNALQ